MQSIKFDSNRSEIRLEATSRDFQSFPQARTQQYFAVEQGQLNKNGEQVFGVFVVKRKQGEMMKELLASVPAWWRSVTPREQKNGNGHRRFDGTRYRLLGHMAAFGERTAQAQARLQTEKQLLSWVSENANDIVTLRAQGQ